MNSITEILLNGRKEKSISKRVFDLFESNKNSSLPCNQVAPESKIEDYSSLEDELANQRQKKRKLFKSISVPNRGSESLSKHERKYNSVKLFRQQSQNNSVISEEDQNHQSDECDMNSNVLDSKGDNVKEDNLEILENFSQNENQVARTIFIGNLPVKLTLKKLKKLLKERFSSYGSVESIRFRSAAIGNPKLSKRANVICETLHGDRDTIHAYLVFSSEKSAANSLQENNSLIGNHHIRVDLASRKAHAPSKYSVFIGNLPYTSSEEDLRAYFSQCGEIQAIRIVRDREFSIGKGIGFVTFESSESVDKALELNNSLFLDRPLRVLRCHRKSKKGNKADASELNNRKINAKKNSKMESLNKNRFHENPAKRRIKGKLLKSHFQGLTSVRGKVPSSLKKISKYKKSR